MPEEPKLINDLTRYINQVIFVIEQGGCDEHGIDFANFRLDYLIRLIVIHLYPESKIEAPTDRAAHCGSHSIYL